MNLIGIAEEARTQYKSAQLRNLYRKDYQAWKADILGYRTYEKMREITDTALFGDINRTAIKSSNGTSKDLDVDTPILTTEGWKTMGTVEVGDFVYSETGEPIEVVWKSEVFNKPSYKVTFDDGSYLIGSDSHEWNTLTLKARNTIKAQDWRDHWDATETVTTGHIAQTLLQGKTRNHLIPLASPVQFPEQDLPMHPYALGVWLGDGTSIRAEITCNYEVDGYIIDRLEELGYPVVHPTREEAPYRFSFIRNTRGKRNSPTSEFKKQLDELGVTGNKHIPEAYLRGSVEQRIELLRGLMDTDGWCTAKSSISAWGQTDETLVRQFGELLTSLGIRYSLSSHMPKIGRKAYKFEFRSNFDPFTPGKRKSLQWQKASKAQRSRTTGRTIVSVEEVPSRPTQCIQVDSERHLYLAGKELIPTHNSFEVAAMINWVAAVHEPGEAVSIVTAPSIGQLDKVIFTYLKANHARAAERGNPLPGWINESLEYKVKGPSGNIDLAFGRKPAAGQEVSVFQGTRSQHGKTFVFIEEAGGVSKNLFTAAEAVLTGADARGIYIGNPDIAGGEWQSIFEDKKYEGEFNRFTISSFDLPTFTGEVVYPDDPDMQTRMLKSLTQVSWVEHKKRIWGEHDDRYRSKVLGEFPADGGNGFFPQGTINKALETDIPEDLSTPVILGVDIARMGADESVVYSNRGGRVRLEGAWGKTDTYTSSQKIFEIAQRLQPAEIRIDGTGVGGGVWDNLAQNAEFAGSWDVIGIEGAHSSPDKAKWANKRAYIHDSTREAMFNGEIDIDVEDEELREQLSLISYGFSKYGGIQIAQKADMKTEMGGSPDRADAFVYATCDLSLWTGNPINQLSAGEQIVLDPEDMVASQPIQWYGNPWDAF